MDATQESWRYIILFSIAASFFANKRRNTRCTVTSKVSLEVYCLQQQIITEELLVEMETVG
jgi:hypothetical protein